MYAIKALDPITPFFLSPSNGSEMLSFRPTAPYIKERVWHPSQNIKNNKDGSIDLSMKIKHLFEIKRWIQSWGASPRVLEPIELIKAVKNDLESMKNLYEPQL